MTLQFWKTKPLHEMRGEEWEALCDGCGICCLHKLQDEESGDIRLTVVSCRYLDIERVRCTVYRDPYVKPDYCIKITPNNIHQFSWLPDTCAYLCLAENRDLAWWHPLVSGNPETVHQAGISVRNKAVSECIVHPEDMAQFILPKE